MKKMTIKVSIEHDRATVSGQRAFKG